MPSQNVIVTGAASGIGLACAKQLIEKGDRVAALDIQVEALEKHFAGDIGVETMRLDAGSPESCQDAIKQAIDFLGHIDAFIHLAGVWSGTSWLDSAPSEWERVLRVNLTGSFFLAQSAAKAMLARGQGSIVLTASDSARVGGVAGGPAYASSKGGVIALTRSLARALGPKGIRVNAINPGVVESPMTEAWPKPLMQETLARTPLGRLAVPSDVASVACFLASDDARFITGEIVEVNGGFYFD